MKRYFRFIGYLFIGAAFSGALADSFVDYFRAVNVDNVGKVNELLARGFDPNAANDKGQVGLYLAIRDESPRVAAALLAQRTLKIDATTPSDETPLMLAAIKGNLDWVRRLAEHGAQINRPGWTPLHYAASGPEPKVVQWLLDHGAAIDAVSPNGSTPLMMAARYGAQDSADLLLARGADASRRNQAGLTAADFARAEERGALALRLQQAAAGGR